MEEAWGVRNGGLDWGGGVVLMITNTRSGGACAGEVFSFLAPTMWLTTFMTQNGSMDMCHNGEMKLGFLR